MKRNILLIIALILILLGMISWIYHYKQLQEDYNNCDLQIRRQMAEGGMKFYGCTKMARAGAIETFPRLGAYILIPIGLLLIFVVIINKKSKRKKK